MRSDNEVEAMYEDVSRAIHTSNTHVTVVMGDRNTRLGTRDGEGKVGPFGYGHRTICLLTFCRRKNHYELLLQVEATSQVDLDKP